MNRRELSFPNSYSEFTTPNGQGSTNTQIRKYSVTTNVGNAITAVSTAANGASFTININGVYAISRVDSETAQSVFGISLNSNQLTTRIDSITSANMLCYKDVTGNGKGDVLYWIQYFNAGDVIRPHDGPTLPDGTDSKFKMRVTFLGPF